MPPTIRAEMSTGERIAVWRQYRGMTQESCAGLVGKSLSWWKKIESGVRRVEKLSDLVLIAQVMKVRDIGDLTGGVEFSLALDRSGDHPVVPEIRAAMLGVSVPPRQPASVPPRADLAERLATAQQAFHTQRMLVRETGRLLPGLITDATAAVRASQTATERRGASGLLSAVYVLTAQVLRHASAFDLAWTAIDRATHCAHDADDPVRVAWAVWQSSGVLKDLGRADEGLVLCQEVLGMLEPRLATPTDRYLSLYGEMNLQTALMAGHCSDEGNALRYWDTGEAAYRRISPGYRNPVTRYARNGGIWPAVWVNIALGKSRAAISAADHIDVDEVPSRPLQSLWRLNLARGYAARREDVSTLHVLRQAEAASPETVAQSGHVREMCRDMLRRDCKPIGRELREFTHRIGMLT